MSEILAADYYVNNARLFEAVAKLWVKPDDIVLDPTFGKGGFYKRYQPTNLIAHDLDVTKGDGVDFRHLPEADSSVDVVVFDPAYVTPGGRATSTIPEMNAAYGMDTAEATLKGQERVILDGLDECRRVVKPGGLVMLKVMAYISSGSYQNYPYLMTMALEVRGLHVVDQFMLVKRSAGPQPKNRTRKCPKCKGAKDIEVANFLPVGDGLEWDGTSVARARCWKCEGIGRIASKQEHARNNVSFLIVARKSK